jgi:RNA polymerase sigma-70 factor (ECF subfamily)
MNRSGALKASSPPAAPRPALAPAPLQQVFRQHAAFVASLAHHLIGRSEEIDDVVQDVFLVAIRGIDALRDPAAVRHWLATVTVRVSRRRLRALRLRRWVGLDDAPEYESLAAPGATPEDRALLARVYAVLDGMPANHRLAWCLRNIQGCELEAVALLSGCSLATAKRWIGAAQAELRKVVDDA